MNALHPDSLDSRALDVYLQPHSDDICFSLGAFANRRHCGILLTIFPISRYVPLRPGATHPGAEWVTKTRIAEDTAFAEACGLSAHRLGLQESSLMGHQPFDLGWVNDNLQRIKSPLLDALLAAPIDKPPHARPWLFCPSGIGGHVDHVAARMLIVQNYEKLSLRYCIGFYEDLHYASSAAARNAGINNLFQAMGGRKLHRYVFPLGENVSRKLALIQLYSSQFLAMPQSIGKFTPAVASPNSPHEAVWSDEPEGPILMTRQAA